MIIQSGYGTLAYSGIATSSMQWQDGKMSSSAIADPAKNAVQVTLSGAGKALAASESNVGKSNKYEWLSKDAHELSEPMADKLAQDMSYASDGILLDINNSVNGAWRLAGSDNILTDAEKNHFEQLSSKVRKDRINIYETEKSKGTPAANIMDKILSYNQNLPEKYKELSGWV